MTETDVVDYLLNKNSIFRNSYNLYQNILYYLQHRDYNRFNEIINFKYECISKEISNTLNTLKNILNILKIL